MGRWARAAALAAAAALLAIAALAPTRALAVRPPAPMASYVEYDDEGAPAAPAAATAAEEHRGAAPAAGEGVVVEGASGRYLGASRSRASPRRLLQSSCGYGERVSFYGEWECCDGASATHASYSTDGGSHGDNYRITITKKYEGTYVTSTECVVSDNGSDCDGPACSRSYGNDCYFSTAAVASTSTRMCLKATCNNRFAPCDISSVRVTFSTVRFSGGGGGGGGGGGSSGVAGVAGGLGGTVAGLLLLWFLVKLCRNNMSVLRESLSRQRRPYRTSKRVVVEGSSIAGTASATRVVPIGTAATSAATAPQTSIVGDMVDADDSETLEAQRVFESLWEDQASGRSWEPPREDQEAAAFVPMALAAASAGGPARPPQGAEDAALHEELSSQGVSNHAGTLAKLGARRVSDLRYLNEDDLRSHMQPADAKHLDGALQAIVRRHDSAKGFRAWLEGLGLAAHSDKLAALGVSCTADMELLEVRDLTDAGVPVVHAKKIMREIVEEREG